MYSKKAPGLAFLLHFFSHPILLSFHLFRCPSFACFVIPTILLFPFLFFFFYFSHPFLGNRSRSCSKPTAPRGEFIRWPEKKFRCFFLSLFFFATRLGRKQPCVVETIFDCRLNTQAIAVPHRIGRQGNRVPRWETRRFRSFLRMGKPGPRANCLAPSRRFAYLFCQIRPRAARVSLIRMVRSGNAVSSYRWMKLRTWTCFERDAIQMTSEGDDVDSLRKRE